MGEIGDYIHYHAWNYYNYGVSKKGPKVGWGEVHKKLLKNYLSQSGNKLNLSQEEKQEIQSLLNELKNENTTDQNIKIIQDRIFYELQEKFEKVLKQINWGDFSISGDREYGVGVSKASNINLNDIEALVNKVDQLQNFLSKNIEKYSSSKAKKDLDTVKNLYYQLINNTKAQMKEDGWGDVVTKAGEVKNSKIDYHGKGVFKAASEARRTLQSVIDTYAKIPPYNLAQGTLFEYAIAVLPEVANKQARFSIGEALKRVKGAETEPVKFNERKFTSLYRTGELKSALEETKVSQGKVDVQLTWNNKDLKISAKNIRVRDVSSNIHILSGSSLLYLLQDVDDVFVNHYLNLFANHKTGEASVESWIKPEREKILNQLRLVLFFKALTGYNYKRTAANLFIVNDILGHGIKVIVMSDLIRKVENHINTINISDGSRGLSQFPKFINQWEGGKESDENFAQERISALLLDVLSRKIYVSFKPTLIYSGLSTKTES